jgi:hypothetical protein
MLHASVLRDGRSAVEQGGEAMQAWRSHDGVVRFAWVQVDRDWIGGAGPSDRRPGMRVRLLCADSKALRAVPVAVADGESSRPWLIEHGTRAVAAALLPAMAPQSLAIALMFAAGSLVQPQLVAAAIGYVGLHFLHREYARRTLRCELESHLRRELALAPV